MTQPDEYELFDRAIERQSEQSEPSSEMTRDEMRELLDRMPLPVRVPRTNVGRQVATSIVDRARRVIQDPSSIRGAVDRATTVGRQTAQGIEQFAIRVAANQSAQRIAKEIVTAEILMHVDNFLESNSNFDANTVKYLVELRKLSVRQRLVNELWETLRGSGYGIEELVQDAAGTIRDLGGPEEVARRVEEDIPLPSQLVDLWAIAGNFALGVIAGESESEAARNAALERTSSDLTSDRAINAFHENVRRGEERRSSSAEAGEREFFIPGRDDAIFYHTSEPIRPNDYRRTDPCVQAGPGGWVHIGGEWFQCP